jgi:diguanylate cyclase (GGDEF)-like protein
LPNQNQEQALKVVRHLRHSLNEGKFLVEEGINAQVTASYGLATLPQDARDKETLLLIADRAMFCGKGRGKDCIMVGRALTPVPEE